MSSNARAARRRAERAALSGHTACAAHRRRHPKGWSGCQEMCLASVHILLNMVATGGYPHFTPVAPAWNRRRRTTVRHHAWAGRRAA